MKRILLILTTILILLLPLWAFGATYYVCKLDTDCNAGDGSGWSTGSDGNNGTAKGTPFASIEAATDVATVGDEIIVGDGTYYDHDSDNAIVKIYPSNTTEWKGTAFTAGNYIYIRAENIHGACLDGQSNTTLYGFSVSPWVGNVINYVKIEGFEIKGTGDSGISSNPGALNDSDHIWIYRCIIHDIARRDVNDGYGKTGIGTGSYTRNWTLERSLIYNIGRTWGGTGDGAGYHRYVHDHGWYAQGAGHIFKNNIFYNIYSGWAIKIDGYLGAFTGSTHTIVNNTFAHDTNPFNDSTIGYHAGHITFYKNYTGYGGAIQSRPTGVIIDNNVFFDPPVSTFSNSGDNAAIQMYNLSAMDDAPVVGDTNIRNNVTNADRLVHVYSGNMCVNDATLDTTDFAAYTGNYDGITTPTILNHADLGMTDPSTNDFTLTASASYLINSGLATNAPDDDYLGISRPQDGADDIGAYEYASGNINPTVTIDTPSDPQSISTGAALNWTCTASDTDGTISTYLWEFGVGSGIANSSSEDPGNRTFNNAGNFIVRITVTDNDGGTGTDTVSVTVAEAGTWTDIKFWWRCEASDFSATNGTLDYCIADDTGVDNGTPTYSTGADLVGDGGSALTINGVGETVTFSTDIVDIWDAGTDLKIGFLWKTRDKTDNTRIVSIYQDGTHELLISQVADDLSVIYDSAGTAAWAQTTGNHIANGTEYYIEVTIDFEEGNDTLKIEYFTDSDGVSVDSATDDDAAVTDFGTATTLVIGDLGGGGADFDIDNLIISNSITRDIKAIRTYTSYPGSTVILNSNDVHQSAVIPSGSILQIPVGETGCKVYNDTIKGVWDIDETTGDCHNVAVPGTVELANGKTLNCDNCYFAESEATIETSGGTVSGSDNQFSVASFGFVNESGGDFHLTASSVLKDTGNSISGLSEDIEGIRVPFNSLVDVGAHEYYVALQEVGGNNVEINYCVFDCQDEVKIGVVVPTTFSGTKLQNVTVIRSSETGVNAGGNLELSNSILRNEAGSDIFIAGLVTVTGGGANNIQDSVKIGDGTYSSGHTTTWSASDPFENFPSDLNLDKDSTCVDTGNKFIWSGKVNIVDVELEYITDSGGSVIAPGGEVDVGAYERYWKDGIIGEEPEKLIDVPRNLIMKVIGVD